MNDLTGQRFGRLTVINKVGVAKSGHVLWLCQCDCGNTKEISSNRLLHKTRPTQSCGCLQKETAARHMQNNSSRQGKVHNVPQNRRLLRIYHGIIARCKNNNNHRCLHYGLKGISVCAEWIDNYRAFEEWALSNDYADHLTIDRIDVNGPYSPDNCRWATQKEQQNNRSNNRIIQYRGEKMTLHELSDKYGLNYKTLWDRLKMGWSIEDAVEKPIRRWK